MIVAPSMTDDQIVALVKSKLEGKPVKRSKLSEASSFYMEKQDLKELAKKMKQVEDDIDKIVKFNRYNGSSAISQLLNALDHADEDRTKKYIGTMVKQMQDDIKGLGKKTADVADLISEIYGSRTSSGMTTLYQTLENIKRGI